MLSHPGVPEGSCTQLSLALALIAHLGTGMSELTPELAVWGWGTMP